MSLFKELFSTDKSNPRYVANSQDTGLSDEQALQRYRYMLQTAPPETIEQAHADAFSRLTPEQRRQVLAELVQAVPNEERAAAERTSVDEPKALARLSTRAEIRQPGFMERVLGTRGPGLAGSLLASFAAGFVGSMVAQSFFSAMEGFGADEEGALGDEGALAQDGNPVPSDEVGFGDEGTFDFGGGDFGIDI
jgi:hypothetical protein